MSWIFILDNNMTVSKCNPEERIKALRSSIDNSKMKLSIYFIMIAGGIFFLFYIKSLIDIHGIFNILFSLLDTRALMRDEGALPGFHFLYFWEMLLPISVMYHIIFERNKISTTLVISIILTLCLLFTGAKTNIFKAFIWSSVTYILTKYETIKLFKLTFTVFAAIFIGVAVFFLHTGFTGELQDVDAQIFDVMTRFSSQFPTFHSLINDPSVNFTGGKLFFLPFVKIANLMMPDIEVPSHILEFYDVPYSTNLGTYLDAFYRDFGIIGVLIFPALFGILSAFIFNFFIFNKNNFFAIFMMSIVLLWTTETPNTAGFIKPSYWFQILLGYALYRFVRITEKPSNSTNLTP